ncbi:hypothetical protein WJN01_10585 [Flavobacteriaceae bacterium SZ-1-7]|uniref:hypothetical protein n=1 Tax=Tamlana sedimenti TaxID=3134126 RepID=UPI00312838C1
MKKIIYVLALSLLTFNCSKSDNNDDSIATFLEKYDGTVWVYSGFDETFYLRIIDNSNSPFEFWEEYGDCFEYYLGIMDDEYDSATTTKNSNNTLEVKFVEEFEGVEYMVLFTLTVTGNSMEIKYSLYEDGKLNDSFSEYLSKTSINVDDLILCENS